jgi:glyoxylate/hydroxypyruvate reductase A
MPTLLVCSEQDDLKTLHAHFQHLAASALPDTSIVLWPEPFDAADVVAVAAWYPPEGLLGSLPNLQLIASIGAGTEHLLRVADLPALVPVTRIVDAAQARGMAEYVLWAALHFHRSFDRMLLQQSRSEWRMPAQREAQHFQVGVMGLGGMGSEVALRLHSNGFSVRGWSRRPRLLAGIPSFSGDAALPDFLNGLDMVVCLLPLTPATTGLCNTRFFAQLKPGAVLVNVGRGEHVVADDLLRALDQGALGAAVLDVFEGEPLPADSPLWHHPKIIVTPHMASAASEPAIAQQIIGNLQRIRAGLTPHHAIDRTLHY